MKFFLYKIVLDNFIKVDKNKKNETLMSAQLNRTEHYSILETMKLIF